MTSLSELLNSLPYEVLKNEILSRIDSVSLLVIRHTLLSNSDYPLSVVEDQESIFKHSLDFFKVFFHAGTVKRNDTLDYAAKNGEIRNI